MKKNTTSLLIVCGGQILLRPSKSEHRENNQFDPPSCSESFNSEQERMECVKKMMKLAKYSKPEISKNFSLINTPMKYNYKDKMGGKLFTGYIMLVKNKDLLKDFLIDKDEQWVGIDEILSGKSGYFITPLFTDVTEKLVEENTHILKNQQEYFV